MKSLRFDLFTGVFVNPFVDYLLHDITLGRIVARIISTIALLAGIYIALLRPAPLSSVGWTLVAPASLFVAYDTLTVNRRIRR